MIAISFLSHLWSLMNSFYGICICFCFSFMPINFEIVSINNACAYKVQVTFNKYFTFGSHVCSVAHTYITHIHEYTHTYTLTCMHVHLYVNRHAWFWLSTHLCMYKQSCPLDVTSTSKQETATFISNITLIYVPTTNMPLKCHSHIHSCADKKQVCQYKCLIWAHWNQKCDKEHCYTHFTLLI